MTPLEKAIEALNCIIRGGGTTMKMRSEGFGHFVMETKWRKCSKEDCEICKSRLPKAPLQVVKP